MSAKKMPRRANATATGEAHRKDRAGGAIYFESTRNIAEHQAEFVVRRARVSPALARAIAALIFEHTGAAQ